MDLATDDASAGTKNAAESTVGNQSKGRIGKIEPVLLKSTKKPVKKTSTANEFSKPDHMKGSKGARWGKGVKPKHAEAPSHPLTKMTSNINSSEGSTHWWHKRHVPSTGLLLNFDGAAHWFDLLPKGNSSIKITKTIFAFMYHLHNTFTTIAAFEPAVPVCTVTDSLFDDITISLEKVYLQEVEYYQRKKTTNINADQKWINEVIQMLLVRHIAF